MQIIQSVNGFFAFFKGVSPPCISFLSCASQRYLIKAASGGVCFACGRPSFGIAQKKAKSA